MGLGFDFMGFDFSHLLQDIFNWKKSRAITIVNKYTSFCGTGAQTILVSIVLNQVVD